MDSRGSKPFATAKGATKGCQECNKGATRVQYGCNKGATKGCQECNKGATKGCQECNKGAIWVQQGCNRSPPPSEQPYGPARGSRSSRHWFNTLAPACHALPIHATLAGSTTCMPPWLLHATLAPACHPGSCMPRIAPALPPPKMFSPATCSNASSRGGGWLRSSAAPGKAAAVRSATAALVQIIISATTSIMGTLGFAFTATGWPASSVCAHTLACGCVRASACAPVCVRTCVCVCSHVCVHARACVRACMRAYVCI